ncbi:AI-2E family transporter [Streptomyces sp. NPDC055103]
MQPGTAPPVTPFLRTAAAYAWRLLIVGLHAYSLFAVLGRFHEIGVALFLGLVVTALLRPVADVVARGLPRPLAVALILLGGIALVLGVLALVGEAVAGERTTLVREFREGIGRIEDWLGRPPFRLHPEALSDLQARIGQFLSSHRSTLVSAALSGAGHVVAVLTTLALALFSAVFFIHAGDRQWACITLAVAAVVALASQGPVVALIVIALIVVMGQIEGHLLHPLVMSWAVRLHPLVVAVSVIAGSIAAGIVGAVVAVPLVSVVWSVHTALRDARATTREGPAGLL